MGSRKEVEYNTQAKRLRYTSGVEHWKCECPYCKRVVHVWFVPESDEEIIEDDCAHWQSLNRERHTMHFMKIKKVSRRKFDRLRDSKGNFAPDPTLFDERPDNGEA